MSITVHAGELKDLAELVPLFDAYRQFYKQASDLEGARAYLLDRLSHGEATVFIAYSNDPAGPRAVGFTLLYDTFTSLLGQRREGYYVHQNDETQANQKLCSPSCQPTRLRCDESIVHVSTKTCLETPTCGAAPTSAEAPRARSRRPGRRRPPAG